MADEKKQDVLNLIKEACPDMNDFDKGYMLGIVEKTARDREKKKATAEPAVTG